MEPYYSENGITIYHADCREVLPQLDGKEVNLIFTSPPYNKAMRISRGWTGKINLSAKMGRFANGYEVHDDAMDFETYGAWQQEIVRLCWNILPDDGAMFYNHKPRIFDGKLWTPLCLTGDYPVRQIIIWSTGAGANLNSGAFAPAHEWIVILAKDRFKLRGMSESAIGDVWNIPPESSLLHPAPFPVALPTRAIRSVNVRTVLDPFAGSGTTLVAAKLCGVPSIGIEQNERYCEIAANRLRQGVLFGADGAA
jgi:DNA modification methylase